MTRDVIFGTRKGGGRWAAFFYFVGLALLRLISLNARQQLFFQLSATLLKLLNLRLVTYVPLVTLKELDDVAVLVTKRIEVFVGCH